MPGLGASDVGTAGTIRPAHTGGNRLDDGSVAALLGGDLLGIALSGVLVAVGKLGCGNRRLVRSAGQNGVRVGRGGACASPARRIHRARRRRRASRATIGRGVPRPAIAAKTDPCATGRAPLRRVPRRAPHRSARREDCPDSAGCYPSSQSLPGVDSTVSMPPTRSEVRGVDDFSTRLHLFEIVATPPSRDAENLAFRHASGT